MRATELYTLSVFIGKLLNTKEMQKKDFIQVIKVFLQFQFLLTRLIAKRFYLFLEGVAERQDLCGPQGGVEREKGGGKGAGGKFPYSLMGDNEGMDAEEKGESSLAMVPLNTVMAASRVGVALTGKMAGMPLQAASYAANLSWNVVSKVSRSIIPSQLSQSESPAQPSTLDAEAKRELVNSLLKAKEDSGKTFSMIAEACSITSVYCAQLFHNQAQLKQRTAEALRRAVPALTGGQIKEMMKAPTRTYDSHVLQDPTVARLNEAVMHYGESLKALINEECGDGVMSSVDFFMTLDKVKDSANEDRLIISFNGKFLPHTEQRVSENITLPN